MENNDPQWIDENLDTENILGASNSGVAPLATWADDTASCYHSVIGTTVYMYLTPYQSRSYARTARFKFGSELQSASISAGSTSRVSASFSGEYGQSYEAQYAIRVSSDNTRTFFSADTITIDWPDDSAVVSYSVSGTTVYMYLTPSQSRSYARTARFKFGSELQSVTIPAYSTSRVSATFSGSYGQTYGAEYAIRTSDSTRTYYSTDTITLSWPDDNATVSYTVSGTSVTMTLKPSQSRSYARIARFKFGTKMESVSIPAGSTAAVSATFTGESGQTYELQYAIRIASDESSRTYFSTDSVTLEELNYKLINIGTSATYNTATISFDIQNPPTSTSMTFTFYLDYEGLDKPRSFSKTKDPGTPHVDAEFSSVPSATKCTLWVVDNTRGVTSSKYVRRTKNNFSWSTNVAAGAAFNILATDWNEYTSQLKAKLEYYATNGEKTYSPATVAKGDQLTAVKVNNIAAVINWLVDNNKGDCTTKVAAVSAGDPVTAAKINLLATCLNQ